jgi:hypothetical protein
MQGVNGPVSNRVDLFILSGGLNGFPQRGSAYT